MYKPPIIPFWFGGASVFYSAYEIQLGGWVLRIHKLSHLRSVLKNRGAQWMRRNYRPILVRKVGELQRYSAVFDFCYFPDWRDYWQDLDEDKTKRWWHIDRGIYDKDAVKKKK